MTLDFNYLYILVALLLGIYQGVIYKKTGPYTQNFLITISLLPALVALVLLCVNGNVGSSIAILGVFSLVRFRSIQGNSREIINIFYSMTIGLLSISGNIAFAISISIIIGLILVIFYNIKFYKTPNLKELKIIVPESLNYDEMFDIILKRYSKNFRLKRIKTTNMGSLFELIYEVELSENVKTKELLDEIRCKNANLNVSLYEIDNNTQL